MKLTQLTERIWYYPFEKERDRPNLGYIRGDKWSLAIDAGHSDVHTAEFYEALQEAGFPLPSLTVLTHWHWDHSFGLHKVHGLSLANTLTNKHLREFREQVHQQGTESFLSLDESIRKEYAGGRPVIITLPDLEFSGEMKLDAGNCPIRLFQTAAPHTDDSTLIEVSGERVLFLGDAAGGPFPTWKKDPGLNQALADAIAGLDVDLCLEGHWIPLSKEQTIKDMLEDE